MTYKNHAGQTYGRLTVVSEAPRNKHNNIMWHCICSCGNTAVVASSALSTGGTKSCGCFRKEITAQRNKDNFKHGLWDTHEYRSWRAMKVRCHNPSDKDFHNYGERGIYVCDEWRNSFIQFLSDMGNCPKNHSIDRIDNSKGYSPENCRWATAKQQARNTRKNRMLTYKGETLPLSAMTEKYGISRTTLRDRLNRGWDIHDAITKPIRKFKS